PATGRKLKPPTRPLLSQDFETHIILNIISANMTKEFHQYYSFQGDHSVIDEREYGHREYGYAQYSTGQLLVVTPADLKCTVTDLGSSEQRFVFGYKRSNKKGHVPTPESVLHILQPDDDSVEIYVGKQSVRGIPCDVWYSCTFWEDMKSTMDLYWYFSDPQKWKPSGGSNSVPVRAWIKGVRFDTNGKPRNFEHKYEFVHWKNRITRPGYYQEMFDMKRQLFRFQMRALGRKADLFGDNVLDEIHDFSTGVAYIIDTARGNCSISPIEENDLDDTADASGHVTMRSAAELLLLEGTGQKPVYTGTRNIRGLDCDVWVAKRVNYPPGSRRNATWEWAFVNVGYFGNTFNITIVYYAPLI
ncbi:EF-hand domain-containing protein D1, partial [Elysia marginata]